MTFALVHYPNIDIKSINSFRRKYDPQVELIAPHITLIFPVAESFAEANLVQHIEGVLSSWQPFPFHLLGVQKSWDGYLFLMIPEGDADIIRLHNELYTGMLAGQRQEEIVFVPHLTLGVFADDSERYAQASEEAKQVQLDYHCVLDTLHLVKINGDKSQIDWTKEFPLRS